jgi:hypothetical protein
MSGTLCPFSCYFSLLFFWADMNRDYKDIRKGCKAAARLGAWIQATFTCDANRHRYSRPSCAAISAVISL